MTSVSSVDPEIVGIDPVIVGGSRDRRWIQRSSVNPEIVGRSSDRRWIQRSSADPVIVPVYQRSFSCLFRIFSCHLGYSWAFVYHSSMFTVVDVLCAVSYTVSKYEWIFSLYC